MNLLKHTAIKHLSYYLSIVTIVVIGFSSCQDSSHLFTRVSSEQSGIIFNNVITVSDSMNILDYEYLYNGGGVGVGDFNNDGLEDLFFSGNMVNNALYLNEGDLKFKDITDQAGISSTGQWSSGIAVVDINADGLLDIHVCNNTWEDKELRKNNVYINQGIDKNGVPQFKDMAAAYGLDDDSYSVNSAFFDYDNDGDLDVITIINEMQETRFPSQFEKKKKRKEFYQRIDRLFRNEFNEELGHPVFTNVSDEAGITVAGFSLGVNIVDINKDGWKDIFITNDFLSNDIFYINQQDGTFKDEAKSFFKHTSHSAMGNDVVDINNDGLEDIIALDMLPEDNYRQKKLLGPNNYITYINNEKYDYTFQYVRNTLQLNQGNIPENNMPIFSEVSMFSGVSATDWSWTPLVADFDNDGYKDIIITNGFPKDVTDHDFIDYKADAVRFASKEMMLKMIPAIKAKNCGFRNQGNSRFENVTDEWGFDDVSFSNGAAYADLDNDGDLDVVMNNIYDEVFLYENNSSTTESGNYIQLSLIGNEKNVNALGAEVKINNGAEYISHQHSPFRGYLSTHSQFIHIGLGELDTVKQLQIKWPDGSTSRHNDLIANRRYEFDYNEVTRTNNSEKSNVQALFKQSEAIKFTHEEDDYIDYNHQPLLPHKLSEYGPGLAVGDINNDGLDDAYLSGATFRNGQFFVQSPDGEFNIVELKANDPDMEELGTLLFDADGDKDLDLYIVSGSYEKAPEDPILQDRIFENTNGVFTYKPTALPFHLHNGLSVKAADVDQDGDLDLFVGGRAEQNNFPKRLDSYLYINESNGGQIKFADAGDSYNDLLKNIGMVTDALFTDFTNDGKVDLIILREMDELLFLENTGNGFSKYNNSSTESISGFWNSISAGDLDHDGDIDYVLGNRGLNQFNPITPETPYRIYVKDFDNNGKVDILPFAYFLNREGEYAEFPFVSRLDLTKEINSTRRKFTSFEKYSTAQLVDIVADSLVKEADIFEINYVHTSWLEHTDRGFTLHKLPDEAQLAPVYGSDIIDVNNDGLNDIVLVGNDHSNEIFFGKQNALNGLVLINSDGGKFEPLSLRDSGFLAEGNAKSMVRIIHKDKEAVLVGQNRGDLKLFTFESDGTIISTEQDDFILSYTLNGQPFKKELALGSGYLSQSSRNIAIPKNAVDVTLTKFNGQVRSIEQ